ncbi:hypothetical protein DFH06DRAFT_1151934 [Mycena polygramma]|nr:hypothetical protein DFH06DRAFT_1151934 [Mycena polygramma]
MCLYRTALAYAGVPVLKNLGFLWRTNPIYFSDWFGWRWYSICANSSTNVCYLELRRVFSPIRHGRRRCFRVLFAVFDCSIEARYSLNKFLVRLYSTRLYSVSGSCVLPPELLIAIFWFAFGVPSTFSQYREAAAFRDRFAQICSYLRSFVRNTSALWTDLTVGDPLCVARVACRVADSVSIVRTVRVGLGVVSGPLLSRLFDALRPISMCCVAFHLRFSAAPGQVDIVSECFRRLDFRCLQTFTLHNASLERCDARFAYGLVARHVRVARIVNVALQLSWPTTFGSLTHLVLVGKDSSSYPTWFDYQNFCHRLPNLCALTLDRIGCGFLPDPASASPLIPLPKLRSLRLHFPDDLTLSHLLTRMRLPVVMSVLMAVPNAQHLEDLVEFGATFLATVKNLQLVSDFSRGDLAPFFRSCQSLHSLELSQRYDAVFSSLDGSRSAHLPCPLLRELGLYCTPSARVRDFLISRANGALPLERVKFKRRITEIDFRGESALWILQHCVVEIWAGYTVPFWARSLMSYSSSVMCVNIIEREDDEFDLSMLNEGYLEYIKSQSECELELDPFKACPAEVVSEILLRVPPPFEAWPRRHVRCRLEIATLSRRFREIVLRDPRFWACVYVDESTNPEVLRHEVALAKSVSVSLHVAMLHPHSRLLPGKFNLESNRMDVSYGPVYNGHWDRIMELVHSCMPTCRNFAVSTSTWRHTEFILRKMHTLDGSAVRSIFLNTATYSVDFQREAPHRRLFPHHDFLNNLQSFVMHQTFVLGCVGMYRHPRFGQSAYICGLIETQLSLGYVDDAIVLLLQHLSFPAIHTLDFTGHAESLEPIFVFTFVATCRFLSFVKHLSLDVNLSVKTLAYILVGMPSLRYLDLRQYSKPAALRMHAIMLHWGDICPAMECIWFSERIPSEIMHGMLSAAGPKHFGSNLCIVALGEKDTLGWCTVPVEYRMKDGVIVFSYSAYDKYKLVEFVRV